MTLKKPCLIAETPRAGRWNGCLIISEGAQIDHATAVQYTTEARKHSRGRDYLMISHKVEQPTTGRTGDELLILAGIVTTSFSPTQIEELESLLHGFLDDLGELVVQTIEWDEDRQPSIIERPELSTWLDKLLLVHARAAKKQRSGPKIGKFLIVMIVLVMIVIAVLWFGNGQLPNSRSDGPKVSSVDDTEGPVEEQKRLSRELKTWRDDLGLPKVDQDSKANAREIVDILEAKLILKGLRSDIKVDPEHRLGQLLAEFDDIHPEDRKPGARDQEGHDRKQKQPIALIEDNGTRRRVIDFYKSYQRLDSDGAAYAYKDLKSKKEQLISSDVEAFRRLVETAHAVVKQANDLRSEHGESDDKILASVQKAENEPRAAFDRVMALRWSFYVPDDVVAVDKLTMLMRTIVYAREDNDSEGQSTGANRGTGEIFRQFNQKEEAFNERKGAAPPVNKKFYDDLIELAKGTKKFLSNTQKTNAEQSQNAK